jgi:hypothetical protein
MIASIQWSAFSHASTPFLPSAPRPGFARARTRAEGMPMCPQLRLVYIRLCREPAASSDSLEGDVLHTVPHWHLGPRWCSQASGWPLESLLSSLHRRPVLPDVEVISQQPGDPHGCITHASDSTGPLLPMPWLEWSARKGGTVWSGMAARSAEGVAKEKAPTRSLQQRITPLPPRCLGRFNT